MFQKRSWSVSFWWFDGKTNSLKWNWTLIKNSCAFCRRHLPRVLRSRQFLVCWSTNELSPLSCALFPELRKHRPYFRDPSNHFTQRNAQCFHQWIHSHASEPLHVPSGWHDDVVDMMIWLTWWWKSWPRQLSVTRKFSNQIPLTNVTSLNHLLIDRMNIPYLIGHLDVIVLTSSSHDIWQDGLRTRIWIKSQAVRCSGSNWVFGLMVSFVYH